MEDSTGFRQRARENALVFFQKSFPDELVALLRAELGAGFRKAAQAASVSYDGEEISLRCACASSLDLFFNGKFLATLPPPPNPGQAATLK